MQNFKSQVSLYLRLEVHSVEVIPQWKIVVLKIPKHQLQHIYVDFRMHLVRELFAVSKRFIEKIYIFERIEREKFYTQAEPHQTQDLNIRL